MFKVTARDQGRYKGPSGAFVTYCNISCFLIEIYVVTPQLNRLDETVLMMGHNIRFYGEIWLIILALSLSPFLIWSTGYTSMFLFLSHFYKGE